MTLKKVLFVMVLMPIVMLGAAHADIASTDYVTDYVNGAAYSAGTNVTIDNRQISVASASDTTAGVAKLGEIPYKEDGAYVTSAMMWVE